MPQSFHFHGSKSTSEVLAKSQLRTSRRHNERHINAKHFESFNVKISNTVIVLFWLIKMFLGFFCTVPLLSWHTRTVLSLVRKHWTSNSAVPSLQQSNEFSVPQSGGPVSVQLEQIQGLFIFKSKSCLVKGQVAWCREPRNLPTTSVSTEDEAVSKSSAVTSHL